MKTREHAGMLAGPASAIVSVVLALATFAGVWLLLFPRTGSDGVFRVDEAHKVSETVALRLLLEGRWNDPLWFRESVDRTNPQFGKFYLGAGVLLAGEELPREPSLSRLARPLMPPYASAPDAAPYVPLLAAARRASLLATAITAALLAFLAARTQGVVAALVGVAWFSGHWMTQQFGATAIFDPLLACLIFATGAQVAAIVARPTRAVALSPLVALTCAAAFQTRLNGGVAFAAAMLVIGVQWVRSRSKNLLLGAALLVVLFPAASVALNPYYWATAPDDPAIPAHLRSNESLLPRVVHRIRSQVSELSTILGHVRAAGVRLPLWAADSPDRKPVEWNGLARMRFAVLTIADGPPGILMLLAAILGVIVVLWRGDDRSLHSMWAFAVALVTILWLPVPWARYLTPVQPIVALYGGVGCAALLDRAASRVSAFFSVGMNAPGDPSRGSG